MPSQGELIGTYFSDFGRPVLMAGTALSAELNAISDIAISAMSPARRTSLFLAGCESRAARNFSASIASYSSLGKVKLSRTSLGFLALVFFSGTGTAGFRVALAAVVRLRGDAVDAAGDFRTAVRAGLMGAKGSAVADDWDG